MGKRRGRKSAQQQEVDPFQEFMQLGRDLDAGLYGPDPVTDEQTIYNNMHGQPAADRERVARKHFNCSWQELVDGLGDWVQAYEDGRKRFSEELDRLSDLMSEDN